MPKAQDIAGKTFGRLTALAPTGESRKNQGRMWKCSCSCGGVTEVAVGVLNYGGVVSCGCYRVEHGAVLGRRRAKHGEGHGHKTKEYRAWTSMNERCNYPRHPSYPRYGGRGIKICAAWKDYRVFLSDMGRAPVGYSLERVDVDKGYSPDNCKWATVKEQMNNKTNTPYITLDGVRRKAVEVAVELGITQDTLSSYIRVHKLLRSKYGLIE